jgi:hypothetical protein
MMTRASERGKAWDHIVVESSGVAEPREIRDNFRQSMNSMQDVVQGTRLDTLVTVVDASTFLAEYEKRNRVNQVREGPLPRPARARPRASPLFPRPLALDLAGARPPPAIGRAPCTWRPALFRFCSNTSLSPSRLPPAGRPQAALTCFPPYLFAAAAASPPCLSCVALCISLHLLLRPPPETLSTPLSLHAPPLVRRGSTSAPTTTRRPTRGRWSTSCASRCEHARETRQCEHVEHNRMNTSLRNTPPSYPFNTCASVWGSCQCETCQCEAECSKHAFTQPTGHV